jgi:hypothetical protein
MKMLLAALATVAITGAANAQRIAVHGTEFQIGNHRIWISGSNTPWNKWNDFGGAYDDAWWRAAFHDLSQNHVNATRVWISCNGDNASPGIQPDGTVTAPTAKFWSDLDHLFAIAKSEHVYLMLALISFDHTKDGNRNAASWRKMQSTKEGRTSFVSQYALPLIQRYKNNSYFFAIDVGNEIDWHWDNQGMKQEDTVDLIARVANAVHQNSKVLVCQGMGTAAKYLSAKYKGNCLSDASLSAKQPGAYVDFYNIHYYDWVRQWFSSPFDQSPTEMGITGKPAIVGECPAKGSAGMSIEENYGKAFAKGWQGIMPWTSNGVDGNGKLSDMAAGPAWFYKTNPRLVDRK